jgi:hypothetical protein
MQGVPGLVGYQNSQLRPGGNPAVEPAAGIYPMTSHGLGALSMAVLTLRVPIIHPCWSELWMRFSVCATHRLPIAPVAERCDRHRRQCPACLCRGRQTVGVVL